MDRAVSNDLFTPYDEAEYAATRQQLKKSKPLFENISQQEIAAGVPGYAAILYAKEHSCDGRRSSLKKLSRLRRGV